MSPSAIVAFLLLHTLIFYNGAAGFEIGIGSRSILRSIDGAESENLDYAVDLNVSNFDTVLREAKASYAIVEFFAHWCPACRNYKPQYEKIAKLFNGGDAAYQGIILMTRVDCALKINTALCDKFSVDHFPMLFWGPPSKFVSGSWNPKQENSEIRLIENFRTAELLLNWINKQTNSSYRSDDRKYEINMLQINESRFRQIATAAHDIEEATAIAFRIILDNKMIKPETRSSLLKFLQILVVHHPSRSCRTGTAEILIDFDDFPATKNETGICGKDVPRGYWEFCRGSKNETRGFSCGLWILFHSLSVRVADEESQTAFTTICDFIRNFFACQECRQHFYSMCSTVSNPFQTQRDFAVWLWKAHNKVNERLMNEEVSLGTGDPEFPKTPWPPRQLCPKCSVSRSGGSRIDWNVDEVYRFLVTYYGETLQSRYNGSNRTVERLTDDSVASPNAVMVPVGAAAAIAVVSFAFGAFAYFWHRKRKIRKYKHDPYTLKTI
ncbi:sulfhydryl oxidase 1-like [Andrographis paniculata]|uniref:sulfhydryl oxidase 1-like n=1 Tax=Andrographis paniculata TaxID=175694 RepID=UPI0021E794EB|nr:sulfhydryl oxidase 1-like [Andrographis paniculata]